MAINTLNILLKAKSGDIKKPSKIIEIKRLSEQFGEKVEFKIEAISSNRHAEIQEQAVSIDKKGNVTVNSQKIQQLCLIEGIVEPSLKTQELLGHFEVVTPVDLLNKLFLPGEIMELFNEINKLSGFKDDDEEEKVNTIKN